MAKQVSLPQVGSLYDARMELSDSILDFDKDRAVDDTESELFLTFLAFIAWLGAFGSAILATPIVSVRALLLMLPQWLITAQTPLRQRMTAPRYD
ncbi:hypothetical protein CCACVL1_23604 [Corchorus capsularis]|uniref:Uncharacterized protein n=1 Tax=Corchorus capsularis TaxID=210143 RepID=A0A1R3GT87_COCAP|nr:hypothetical protein CCACVL1_23604 [Corchorus capsularis]